MGLTFTTTKYLNLFLIAFILSLSLINLVTSIPPYFLLPRHSQNAHSLLGLSRPRARPRESQTSGQLRGSTTHVQEQRSIMTHLSQLDIVLKDAHKVIHSERSTAGEKARQSISTHTLMKQQSREIKEAFDRRAAANNGQTFSQILEIIKERYKQHSDEKKYQEKVSLLQAWKNKRQGRGKTLQTATIPPLQVQKSFSLSGLKKFRPESTFGQAEWFQNMYTWQTSQSAIRNCIQFTQQGMLSDSHYLKMKAQDLYNKLTLVERARVIATFGWQSQENFISVMGLKQLDIVYTELGQKQINQMQQLQKYMHALREFENLQTEKKKHHTQSKQWPRSMYLYEQWLRHLIFRYNKLIPKQVRNNLRKFITQQRTSSSDLGYKKGQQNQYCMMPYGDDKLRRQLEQKIQKLKEVIKNPISQTDQVLFGQLAAFASIQLGHQQLKAFLISSGSSFQQFLTILHHSQFKYEPILSKNKYKFMILDSQDLKNLQVLYLAAQKAQLLSQQQNQFQKMQLIQQIRQLLTGKTRSQTQIIKARFESYYGKSYRQIKDQNGLPRKVSTSLSPMSSIKPKTKKGRETSQPSSSSSFSTLRGAQGGIEGPYSQGQAERDEKTKKGRETSQPSSSSSFSTLRGAQGGIEGLYSQYQAERDENPQ